VQVDYLVGDFGDLGWQGWRATNYKQETLYAPETFCGFDEAGRELVAPDWSRVDLHHKLKFSLRGGQNTKCLGRYFLLDMKEIQRHAYSELFVCQVHACLSLHCECTANIQIFGNMYIY